MPDFDWRKIRALYETGTTPYRIEQQIGGRPTRQAIEKRARKEGWKGSERVPATKEVATVTERHTVATAAMERIRTELPDARLLSDNALSDALKAYEDTGNHAVAAAMASVHRETWRRWRETSPALRAEIEAICARKAAKSWQRIDSAAKRGDWKADEWLLRNNAVTKDSVSDKPGAAANVGIQVVLNMPKPGELPDVQVIDVTPEEAA